MDEISQLVGTLPRTRKVAHCHGVFDLIHPGHIRHLTYAREKADILIASLTADRHITKGPSARPFVPQDLRAINLAALEMVDYVIIDDEPTPLTNINKIQPDYFAKGYEYKGDAKTREEIAVVESYGGQVLFTPGDVVFSSSAFIETHPPNLSREKLHALMEAEGLSLATMGKLLSELNGIRVHVVGDTIIDSITHTTLIGGMTKSPTASVRVESREDYLGGAAIVAAHLAAAGARVTLSTVLGEDSAAGFVADELARAGVEMRSFSEPTRPTTRKEVFVCAGHRMLKVDTLDNRSISDIVRNRLAEVITDTPADVVIFSDFRHGLFNRRTIPCLTAAIPENTLRVADSQVASRWGNVLDFRGFDLITPNEKEARFALADQDTGVRPLAERLYAESRCRVLMLKLGERGVLTYRPGTRDDPRSFFAVDAFADHVVDAVGAGDALLAYATLALAAGGSAAAATIIGSVAAALECAAEGNVPISCPDVKARLSSLD